MVGAVLPLLLCVAASAWFCVKCEDPYLHFEWTVTYGDISPLGVPQQGILINNEFPGPNLNTTTNNNVVVNIFNKIDEPFLIHWAGIQHRKNSWHDGLPGTNCPIMPGTNFTYRFQVKDQIGSYMYYPSTAMHRAAGAFGGLRINSRPLIPVPYLDPEDDYTILIGDWYSMDHKQIKKQLDDGVPLDKPAGVLINGKNFKPGQEEALFTVKPAKTYKFRICNVGITASLNFQVQGHMLKLVEMEGSHVVQNNYESLDVHLGQCFSTLLTADKEPMDYKMVASTRFTKDILSTAALMRYEGGKPGVSPVPVVEAPPGFTWSLNQFRSFRWNLTASAARPNPQGSYHYGAIEITRTLKLVQTVGKVDGKLRYAINGISFADAETPLKLAEFYDVADKVFKYDLIKDEPPPDVDTVVPTIATHVLNQTFRNFVEIIFENHESNIQSWHLDGYSFFALAVEPGTWSPDKRQNYNLLDAVSRHTVQVFPNSWAAVVTTFDNAGMWNVRSEEVARRYLGQQFYISVLSPQRSLRDEYNIPDNIPICGIVTTMPKPPPYTL